MLTSTEKITTRHQERRAYVYVRQSSLQQVLHHRESQRILIALAERAVALGWPAERVRVIDADLGQSGQDSQRRGFQELVAEVSLGRVGVILAYEASRLARSNADWYALLDLAAVRGTLIADSEGVYDPRSYNDRLLLGLRGMLSEAELHLLRLRMEAGRRRQIERGDYRQQLPTGLVRLPDGRVVKDPDLQVQRTLELIFALFAELGSCQKVLRCLRDKGVRVPRRQTGGPEAGAILWKRPSEAVIYETLHNPAYAGAFVYGRRAAPPDRAPEQREQRQRQTMDEWGMIHYNAYPAYITWETSMANQARLTDNANHYRQYTRGAARSGSALLVGIVVCGRCGRQLHVEDKKHPRYVCSALGKEYGASICLQVDGPSIDEAVVAAFFSALAPAERDLLEEALAQARADQERWKVHHAQQVQRAAYEARLAQRQYQAVDPDNRLVAAELERRWEGALRALAEAQEAQQHFQATQRAPEELDPALRTQLTDLSTHLPQLWASGRLTAEQQKELLRSLIRRIILTRPKPDEVEAKVVWVSGAMTRLSIRPPVQLTRDLRDHDQLVARIRALSAQGYHDGEIAQHLTVEGFRSARSNTVLPSLVKRVRQAEGLVSLTAQFRSQEKIEDCWTTWGLARALNVDRNWLYARIHAGTLPAQRHPVLGQYLIPDDPEVFKQLAAHVPESRR
jgi:DNA invertase Pin-like site-specific DNA recombinase